MKALIIYDSFYGNTEKIAQAIGGALASQADVNVLRVGDVKPEHFNSIDMLVAGSPTRAFSPTPAIKNLLKSIPQNKLSGIKVAAFDTRASLSDVNSRFLAFMVSIFGYAAKPIANLLTKKGGNLVLSPEGFLVTGTEGPLKEGELERAADWAKQIAG